VDTTNPLQKKADAGKAGLAEWFQVPTWKRALSDPSPALAGQLLTSAGKCWILFCDAHGVGEALAARLADHRQQVISVHPAPAFARLDARTYAVNPRERQDYLQLFQSIQQQNTLPLHIVHLWNVTGAEMPAEQILEHGFYSLLALTQALGDAGVESCRLSILADSWRDVLGNETLCPEKATLDGPCVVIPQEYPAYEVQGIDIVLAEALGPDRDLLLTRLLAEMAAPERPPIVALRGKRRWLPAFEPLRLEEEAERAMPLRAGGVYLITGGLGGLGMALAEHLARTCAGVRLVLLGRTPLPPRASWTEIIAREGCETGTGRQLQQILTLEGLGASVMTFSADVADEGRMREVVKHTLGVFGELHGVFHLAGVPGIGLMQWKAREQASAVLAPKVQGTRVLERVLADLPLDFLVLFSSVTAQTGGPGQVDYCAANAFLDAYARSHAEVHGMTLALNWAEWQWNAWEDGLRGFSQEIQAALQETRQRYGITFAEGFEALRRVLPLGLPQVIVSPQNFASLLASSRSMTTESLLTRARSTAPVGGQLHQRPELATSYVAPRDATEQRLAEIWQHLLGIARVGIHDNFFDLGGNSLAGLELISRVRKAFDLADLPTYILYEAPSVGALAGYLAQRQSSQADNAAQTQAAIWQERSEKRRANLKQRMRGSYRTQ
ncbi:MAG TPA: KR domain-containing protein, partial [Ktedonobacteraceae bacterium]|nr:KR domain-containing protein [Ktedonobacteraceae bacterium]